MNRRVKMLRTAIPFFEPRTATILEAAVQTEELKELLSGRKECTDLIVCGGKSAGLDVEGLFQAIREFANESERRIIDMVLQFFQMKHMMDMFQMMEMAGMAQTASDSGMNSDMMMEMLKEGMPKDQQENFEMLQMVLSMMNSGG